MQNQTHPFGMILYLMSKTKFKLPDDSLPQPQVVIKFFIYSFFLFNYWKIHFLIVSLINSFYYQRSLPGIVYRALKLYYKAKDSITQSSINTYTYNNYKKPTISDQRRHRRSTPSRRSRCSTSFTLQLTFDTFKSP